MEIRGSKATRKRARGKLCGCEELAESRSATEKLGSRSEIAVPANHPVRRPGHAPGLEGVTQGFPAGPVLALGVEFTRKAPGSHRSGEDQIPNLVGGFTPRSPLESLSPPVQAVCGFEGVLEGPEGNDVFRSSCLNSSDRLPRKDRLVPARRERHRKNRFCVFTPRSALTMRVTKLRMTA